MYPVRAVWPADDQADHEFTAGQDADNPPTRRPDHPRKLVRNALPVAWQNNEHEPGLIHPRRAPN